MRPQLPSTRNALHMISSFFSKLNIMMISSFEKKRTYHHATGIAVSQIGLACDDASRRHMGCYIQSAELSLFLGFVKSYLGSSAGRWAILQLLCSQARIKLQEEVLNKLNGASRNNHMPRGVLWKSCEYPKWNRDWGRGDWWLDMCPRPLILHMHGKWEKKNRLKSCVLSQIHEYIMYSGSCICIIYCTCVWRLPRCQ